MNFYSFFVFNVIILSIGLGLATVGFECDLRDKIDRGIRDLERGVRHAGRKPAKDVLQSLRQRLTRKNPESALHGLAKNIEVILSKLIPNHNLVQDLMAYVTMPRIVKKYPDFQIELVPPRRYM